MFNPFHLNQPLSFTTAAYINNFPPCPLLKISPSSPSLFPLFLISHQQEHSFNLQHHFSLERSRMEEIEIPQYFLCPISLQIMKDPVTVLTGITYDRESIEHWLMSANDATTCPVTNQPLPKHSDLTPNHMLRRLIQAWCTANASNGVDRIPTPKSPLDKTHVLKLVRDLGVAHLYCTTLKKIEALAAASERNR